MRTARSKRPLKSNPPCPPVPPLTPPTGFDAFDHRKIGLRWPADPLIPVYDSDAGRFRSDRAVASGSLGRRIRQDPKSDPKSGQTPINYKANQSMVYRGLSPL